MNPLDLVPKLHSALPAVREWIEKTLEENQDHAVSVIKLAFPRLKKVFPTELLSRAKVVVVFGEVPFPPLSRLGLAEFSQLETMSPTGITYKDTFFVSHLHQTESLYFHELVHIVQWERLGVDNFLTAYGAGLIQFGYKDSPLENIAYSLQADFDKGVLSANIIEQIQQRTDAVWNDVASLLSGG